MPVTVLILILAMVATVTDIAWHKIYNWTTYTGILAALGLAAAGSLWLWAIGGDEVWLRQRLGWQSLSETLAGLAICGLPMLLCFVLFKMGGGDVKLIAMFGALMGPQQGLETMLWTFVIGACAGLIVLVWRVGAVRMAVRAVRQVLWSLRLGRWSPLGESERAMLRPPLFLAPSALAAVIVVRFDVVEQLARWEVLRRVGL
jgi:prepilin peptidase CpaA